MTKAHAAPSRKLRVSIPAADLSVLQWLDAQASLADSLRALIRESIQRDGYIDVAFKPVEQLPRRGRPPADLDQGRGEGEAQSAPDAGGTAPAQATGHSRATHPDASRPAALPAAQPRPSTPPADEPNDQNRPETSAGVASSNGAGGTDSTGGAGQPAQPGQYDMDDIFGHGS